jgi:hypothetical protein
LEGRNASGKGERLEMSAVHEESALVLRDGDVE